MHQITTGGYPPTADMITAAGSIATDGLAMCRFCLRRYETTAGCLRENYCRGVRGYLHGNCAGCGAGIARPEEMRGAPCGNCGGAVLYGC